MLNQPVVGGGGGGLTTAQVQALIDASDLWQNIGARIRKSTDEEIATGGAPEVLTWDTEDYDNGGLFDAVADNTGFVIVVAGTYYVYARLMWEPNATGTRLCNLLVDGTVIARDRCEAVEQAGNNTEHGVFAEYEFTVGQVITVAAFQNCGAPLDVQASGVTSPVFGIRLVAPPA